ncbi:hypothetical protein Ldro_1954 [Legionella drozanskii LLAP-1]|uniref:Uncharacterized protein n=1 Tax=Legionella drozanskii LLAP-1 TaxID=1212489 RepID=A0A0W0SQY0_9GAMM|nr:hypothetical protein Ldro_1954 [Legionella drozanskii LLAP-1]
MIFSCSRRTCKNELVGLRAYLHGIRGQCRDFARLHNSTYWPVPDPFAKAEGAKAGLKPWNLLHEKCYCLIAKICNINFPNRFERFISAHVNRKHPIASVIFIPTGFAWFGYTHHVVSCSTKSKIIRCI